MYNVLYIGTYTLFSSLTHRPVYCGQSTKCVWNRKNKILLPTPNANIVVKNAVDKY